ncbi:MAG: AtpZ/AtpI family protein [Alphaproteobacteria bacterium]
MAPDNPTDKKNLSERLAALKKNQSKKNGGGKNRNGGKTNAAGYGYGVAMAVEMFAAMVVGFGFGLGMDKWLGTKPWLTIIMGFMGIAAGIINILRITTKP